MRWPWTKRATPPRIAQWNPEEHDSLVASLASVAAAPDNRLVIVLTQGEDGGVGISCWSSTPCAVNVEAVGLMTHGLEAFKRKNADWWDE